MRKHLNEVKERVTERSGEEDLWWMEQQVQNRAMGTNSLGLSDSKEGSIPAGEGEKGGTPRGEVGRALPAPSCGLGLCVILGCLGITLSHYGQKVFYLIICNYFQNVEKHFIE